MPTEKQLEKLNAMATDLDTGKRIVRAFLYGDYGAGKTHLAGSIAKAIGGKVCLVNTDSGWSTLTRDPDLARNITRFQYDSFAQVRMIAEAHNEGIEPYKSFQTLIWDTVTTSVDNTLRDLVELKKFPNEQRDPSLEAYPHYRMASNKLKETVDVLKESDMHVIYIGHVKFPSEQDNRRNKFAIRPNAPEASYNVVGQEVNLIAWLYKEQQGKEVVRKLQTTGTTTETGKSQIPTVPETVMNQNQLVDLLMQWLNY